MCLSVDLKFIDSRLRPVDAGLILIKLDQIRAKSVVGLKEMFK